MKNNIFIILFCSFFSLYAIDAGFDIESNSIFLKKDTNPYIPDIISDFRADVFLNFNFEFNNQTLFMAPGFIIKNNTLRPFFKYLNYSAFTDYFSVQIGKDLINFGEGFIENYFYLNIPSSNKSNNNIWHVKFDIPVNRFMINLGSAVDPIAIDFFKIPKWYSLWLKLFYSNHLLFAGFESDILFEPELDINADDIDGYTYSSETKGSNIYKQKKEYTLKSAFEISFNLPYDFKVYSNAGIPFKLVQKKMSGWGVLAGISKNFISKNYSFTLAGETSYSAKGLGYGFFQSTGLKGVMQFTAGIYGVSKKELNAVIQTELFIDTFKFKIVYITKNLLKKNEDLQGLISVAIALNDF